MITAASITAIYTPLKMAKNTKPTIKRTETPEVNEHTLKIVFNVISGGFNMTKNEIASKLNLSLSYVSTVVNKLFELGNLSRINIKKGKENFCYAYTAIKPLRGNL